MKSVCILGRQPKLGIAELESLFGANAVRPVGNSAAALDIAHEQVPFGRLGGTIKLCKALTVIPSTDLKQILKHLNNVAPQHAGILPAGKLKLGLSSYGLEINTGRLRAAALDLKKTIIKSGRSVRVIPNNELALSSAQVLHNKLTGDLGWEIVLVKNGNETIISQTVKVQDIEAYAARDQARPKRDARIGMLPPKLAQIIINLAASQVPPHQGSILLDPFCGTGVVLQEAILAGFDASGSDLNDRMVEYSRENLAWLLETHGTYIHAETKEERNCLLDLAQADATSHEWIPFPNIVASETYLGRPFSTEPRREILEEVIRDVNTIHRKFLQNMSKQSVAGFRMCLAIPAWRTKKGFKHLPVLDSLAQLGYNRVSFRHVDNKDLIYFREDQVVARELTVIERI